MYRFLEEFLINDRPQFFDSKQQRAFLQKLHLQIFVKQILNLKYNLHFGFLI